ncbi:MAG TPA: VWA domain-containing protein [Propionibacterium sp.]|jgi:Ca-activated chloride channel family protein|nr:VWA domain-containing protein [Propionibacterium sp.]
MTASFLLVHHVVAPLAIEMPDFERPGRLWALALIPALGLLYVGLLRLRGGGRRTHRLPINTDRTWVRHTAVVLALASMVMLTVAWAIPRQSVEVPRERATVVIVMDVSLSMEAADVPPSRLQAAKESAKEFATSLPPGFNVSLVEFAGTASIAVPPTTDRGVVNAAIDNLRLRESTAIGEGIYAALDALLMVPPDPLDPEATPPATIVVLSDGESQRGRSPYVAAETSKEAGVPVNTIAFGTDRGYIIDPRTGRREWVRVNREQLAEIARIGGGQGFYAPSAERLREVYSEIRRSAGTEKVFQEATSRYVGIGLVFGLLAAIGIVSLGARWP